MEATSGVREVFPVSESGGSQARAGDPSLLRDRPATISGLSDRGENDPHVKLAKARLGRSIRGKWTLDALLGVGGTAAVYAATHRNGSRVAIKMLHPAVATEEAKRRFLREGYLANSVGHPGVVQVLDDDEAEDGSMFLVMELLEGESLESYASRRVQLAPGDALAIGEQVLEVLAVAHAKGILHRDVKPENVFLCTSGRVKLLDFGIARLHEASRSALTTHHGFLLGTPAYMAPEQARGDWDIVDGRTDVWSVGATLFRVLTGRTVHQGSSHFEVLMQATTTPAPRVREIAPQVPELVASLVDRALAFRMEERWSSAEDMLERLRSVHRSLGYAASSRLLQKIAAELIVRNGLRRPSSGMHAEVDRTAIDLAGSPDPDADEPTRVASMTGRGHSPFRSRLFEVTVDIDVDVDESEDVSPAPSAFPSPSSKPTSVATVRHAPPADLDARAYPSIFDDTGDATGVVPPKPARAESSISEPDETVPDVPRMSPLPSEPRRIAPIEHPRQRAHRSTIAWWGLALLSVAALIAVLIGRWR